LSTAPNTPSPWRRQQGWVEAPQIDGQAFRLYWRASSQLVKLLEVDAITPTVWHCAQNFRVLYERAHQGELAAQAWDKTFIDLDCRRLDRAAPSAGRLGAARKLVALREALGEVGYILVTMVAVEDASWAAIGRRFTVDPKTARSWRIVALQVSVLARGGNSAVSARRAECPSTWSPVRA
jgi:hypothetical protein